VQCISDANCSGVSGNPACNLDTHQCVPCTRDYGSLPPTCPGNSPSCDPSTHQCVCRIPSAGNQVKNAGFNSGVTPYWNSLLLGLYVNFHPLDDADGCSGSGSVGGFLTNQDPWQCVSLSSPLPQCFGAKFYSSNPGDSTTCRVKYYSNGACNEPALSDYAIGPQGNNQLTGWASYVDSNAVAPSTAKSALVYCDFGEPLTIDGGDASYVDQIYLNTGCSF